MRTLMLALTTTLLLIPTVQAGDAAAGKAKAATCAACHGADGKATLANHPNLAGQRADYLELSLKAYRDGARPNPVMEAMAKPLSDADIANLAAYYASLPPG